MSRRVLIISYYWPPSGGSGVQRWVKFAKYLPPLGWEPVIYTPANPELTSTDESLLSEVSPDLEIIRRPIIEPYSIYHLLAGHRRRGARSGGKGSGAGSGASTEVNPISGGPKTLRERIFLWIRANLFIPDPRIGWVRPSVRFLCRYVKEHPVDAVITTGPPHSMHLIGRGLSRRTGLPWVADFRDPWTDIFYFKFLPLTRRARSRQAAQELSVLREAAAVIAVSPLVKEDFEKRSGRDIAMITNGFDEEDIASAGSFDDGFFNVTHTGLFASYGIPETLWQVLAEKAAGDSEFRSSLHIRLVGKTDREVLESLCQAGLGDNVVDCGYRTHLDAVREQKSAGLLILPLRKDPEYRKVLPGKLFEYLSSCRPVLGIGPRDGAMARVMEEVRGGLGSREEACREVVFPVTVDWGDREGLRRAVDAAWEAFQARRHGAASAGAAAPEGSCALGCGLPDSTTSGDNTAGGLVSGAIPAAGTTPAHGDGEDRLPEAVMQFSRSATSAAPTPEDSLPDAVMQFSRSATTAALAALLDSLVASVL